VATSKKSDETKTAGKDESKDAQTTKEAREEKDALPTEPEARGETDAKADGSKVGAVRDGDVVGDEDSKTEDVVDVKGGESELAPDGLVTERNAVGDEFDVPYVQLTADHLPRTSDSDDPNKSWVSQQAGEREDEEAVALVAPNATPGQTFRVRELPNRAVVEAAGINYEQFVAGLPVRADVEHEAPRKGIPA
jgi:hypothetical protein